MVTPWILIIFLTSLTAAISSFTSSSVSASHDTTHEAVCSADGICQTEFKERSNFPIICEDVDANVCDYLAGSGECTSNPKWMTTYCQKSCGLCIDTNVYQQLKTGLDLGTPQRLEDANFTPQQIQARLELARTHQREYVDTKISCRNHHEVCTVWALGGECESNPSWMKHHCAPVCLSCDILQVTVDDVGDSAQASPSQPLTTTTMTATEQQKIRCPIDPTMPNALVPGDLDRLFERITQEYVDKGLQILSSPEKGGPWVLTIDDFLSAEEAQRLIDMGYLQGYQRSLTNNGQVTMQGTTSSGRTSLNAWCRDPCAQDPLVQGVLHRIETLTGIPERNSEHIQLLKYEPGTFYNRHHDYTAKFKDMQPGVRIVTVFLYLNDVKQGGETNFPDLDITIQPKMGRLLMWPSVQNDHPHDIDERTRHQALLVEGGVKYAANAWIHIRDYKTPDRNGCV